MITIRDFEYVPSEHEAEKASNSYLMSLMAIVVGLPLPIINLLATLIFYFGNRKSTYFVRWHCIQALVSQLSMLAINSVGFWWTVSLVFGDSELDNSYIAYIMVAFLYNFTEFVATVYTAIKARKGVHVEWWFYAGVTDLICRR